MSRKWIIPAILFVTVASAPVLFAPPLSELQQAWQATGSSCVPTGFLDRARAIRPYLLGRRDARSDLSKGHLILKFWGRPVPPSSIYYDLLRKRFGVRSMIVGGCVVMTGAMEEAAGYNDVMMSEIERRHGRAALDRLWREADLLYRAKKGGP
ncbi:MAG TPA: hypothetical protein VKB93_09895 [Thermoanaerobaculia bacterium]|nr:hypothetical protein [Thermoanaerobaculia bacterium]